MDKNQRNLISAALFYPRLLFGDIIFDESGFREFE
jgi:hypothetical protein